jgi:hypothetical protein
MNDLIERLLNPRSFDHEALRKEAAAHIRELEEELDRLRAEKAELISRISSLEKTMAIYVDPFAWKEQHDPENSLFVPDHYEVSGFGDMAKFVLAKTANETEGK